MRTVYLSPDFTQKIRGSCRLLAHLLTPHVESGILLS